ncbi:WD40/YVTN/BNR-like repeat-containing protein [Pseudomonas fluorescens]|uniref:Ycf48-like protein n=1 Tax=Pseudomonas fluorescens TaxID=294 RepID=A0A5E7BZ29_PSEFL|nr:YCF48-related protein [Pseudomonas fluorescens]VVN97478.1 Ycf48-like protein [Pseudomonas fluorescens]
MNKLNPRHLVFALVCQTVALTAYGSEFIDPLERPSPELGSLGTNVRVNAVSRAGERLVAVGPRGLVLVSVDLGQSWTQHQTPLSSDLVAVRFRSDKLGWAVGHDGVVLNTQDGGLTWVKQLDGFKAVERIKAYYDLDGPGAQALPEQMRDDLAHMVADGADKPFLDVLFISDREGFAVGAFNVAMRTLDGGQSWTPIIDKTENPLGYHLYSLALAGDDLYMAGERGLLRRWNASSESFETVETPYEGSFFGVIAKDRDTLFAYGLQGNIFRSADRGQSWTHLGVPGEASITSAALLPDDRLVFVDLGGRVLITADDGQTFTPLTGKRAMPYFGVTSAQDGRVLVVGRNGTDVISTPDQPDRTTRR